MSYLKVIFRDPSSTSAGAKGDALCGTRDVELIRPTRLCAPSDKNGEDPTAPLDPGHLIGYDIKHASPAFLKLKEFLGTP